MLIIAVLTVVVYAAPSDLDTTFDGNVTNPFSYGSDYGRSGAIQSDGKLVVAGNA